MTTIDPSAVATMQGRELDANLAVRLFGLTPAVVLNRNGWWVKDADERLHEAPHYSTDPVAFFAMVKKVRESGWEWESHHSGEQVVLYGHGRTVYGNADTLPLAFARAALLTTIPNGGAS